MTFSERIKNNLNSLKTVDMSPCTHNLGLRCIRIMLWLVNVLFLILGILLISVGTTIHAVYNDVQLLLGAEWFSPALMLTVLGVLVLMVTAFGCLGTFKNSTCMINTFGALLLGLFVLEVIAAVSSFAMSGTVNALIGKSLKHSFNECKNNNEDQCERIDFLQQEMRCCGINHFDDWYKIMHNETLPDSCCSYYRTGDDYYRRDQNDHKRYEAMCVPYQIGCTRSLHYLITTCAVALAIGTAIVSVIQILGVTFAFQLAKSIRQAKTAQDMERCAILRQESEPLPQTQSDQEQIESRGNEYKYIE